MNLAFLFPGQGSQSVGMLSTYAEKYKEIKDTFKEASDILSQDLFDLINKGPENQLNLTVNTQPAILAASVGLWRVWNSLTNTLPNIMSGHSLGEYSALTCANVFKFSDAIRVVRKRAELMQKSVPTSQGLMAVVLGLEAKQVINLCNQASQDDIVEAVNFNTETQIVVAGHKTAVKKLIKLAKETKVSRCMLLPISVPAHSSLLKDIAQEFEEFLSTIPMQKPNIPVLHNADVETHQNIDGIRKILVSQLHMPVRWLEIVHKIRNENVQSFIEIGPGHVLTNLNRHIDKKMNTLSTEKPEYMEKALASIAA